MTGLSPFRFCGRMPCLGRCRSGRAPADAVPLFSNVPRPSASSFISRKEAPHRRERCQQWLLIGRSPAACPGEQGVGCFPPRNKGGAKRGTFAEGSTRRPVHPSRTAASQNRCVTEQQDPPKNPIGNLT